MSQKFKHSLIATLAASGAVLASLPAQAQFVNQEYAGPYIGVGAGAARLKGDDFPSAPTDRSSTGGKAFVGYQFNQFFGIEAGGVNTGKFDSSVGSLRGQGAFIDAVGRFPISNSFSATARLGAFHGKLKDGRSGVQLTDDGTNVKGGLGVQYAFNNHNTIGLEWERYRFDGVATDSRVNTDLYTVGYRYKF